MDHCMRSGKRSFLARESCILLTICFVDLLFTLWLVCTRHGVEGNPLMSYYLRYGWLPLIGAKIVLIVSPIFIAEWARRFRTAFVERALRFAIVAYLSLYAVAFMNAGISAGGITR